MIKRILEKKAGKKVEENSEKPKLLLNENQIIGIWGSPGSGKTTTSIKLAEKLASKGLNTIIVFTDINCPVIPTLIKNNKEQDKSLGKVLISNINQQIIKDNLITLDKNDNIAMLGYAKGENYKSYPAYVEEIIDDLILHLRQLADYIIIDMESIIKDVIINDTLFQRCDKIISLCTADLKGLSFFSSNLPMLIDTKYKTSEHLMVVSNIMPYQGKETVNDVLKGKGIYLEHIEEITNQTSEQRLFEPLITKESLDYKENLEKLLVEVISHGN